MARVLLLPFALTACVSFPEVDAVMLAAARDAPFPALLPTAPFDATLSGQPAPVPAQPLGAELDALQARAATLRGPVLNDADRARLAR